MTNTESILCVDKLRVCFDGFVAVEQTSFTLKRGETLAIVGESGSGKSITALSLMGLLPKSANVSGGIRISVNGAERSMSDEAWGRLRGSTIGMVFQEPMSSLNPVMQVGEQITESIVLHAGMSVKKARQITIDWLSKVHLPNPEELYSRYPHQLSGGQKQRVMIAMAMCNNPVLLIADEPTTALDVTVQKEIMQLMQDLQQAHGTSMIFITHDLALAAKVADKVMVMYKGQVVEQGRANEVLNNSSEPYTKALLACRPEASHKGKRLPIVEDYLQGNRVEQKETMTTVSGESILSVKGLRVWFEEGRSWWGKPASYYKAVDDVSFDIKKGEVLGLVGESGCGKSTISKSLMGLLPIKEGQVLFEGKDLSLNSNAEWRAARKDIQMIFQDPYASLNPRMNIEDMLLEPLQVHNIVPGADRKKEVQRLLDLVQLPADSLKRYPHQFSGGQRQRLGIARALAVRPKLIICDESVSALDVSVQAQILNLLKDLQSAFNLSYLFISHDLNVVHYISDRVMVMQAGKLVETGKAEQVLQNPTHNYTMQLVAAMS